MKVVVRRRSQKAKNLMKKLKNQRKRKLPMLKVNNNSWKINQNQWMIKVVNLIKTYQKIVSLY